MTHPSQIQRFSIAALLAATLGTSLAFQPGTQPSPPATPPASTPPATPPATPPTTPPPGPGVGDPGTAPGAPPAPVDPKQLEEDIRRRIEEVRRKSGLPGMPGPSTTPGAPGVPGAPGMPGAPSIPGVPGAPGGTEPGAHIPPPRPTPPPRPQLSPEELQKAWAKATTAGPQHEKLVKDLVGTWEVTLQVWQDPNQPPKIAKGKATMTALFEGRYVRTELSAMLPPELGGKEFVGIGLTGYNHGLAKYEATWIDNQGTGVLISTGTADEQGAITYMAEQADPVTGELRKSKTVERYEQDKIISETYDVGPAGQTVKTLIAEYTRVPPKP